MTDRELMQQALRALEKLRVGLLTMQKHAESYGESWARAYVKEYRDMLPGAAEQQFRALNAMQHRLSDVAEGVIEGFDAIVALRERLAQPGQQDCWQEEARRYAQNAEFWRGKYEAAIAQQPDHIGDVNKMVLVEDLAAELFAVAQQSPADDGFSDTINRIEAWLRKHFTIPLQPEQEPVAWPCHIIEADFSERTITLGMESGDYKVSAGTHYLSTTQPQRTWVGLTDEEMVDLQDRCGISIHQSDFEAIEAKLKEKNT